MAEEQTRAVRRVVVAVDGSPQSRAALEWAAVIGSAIGATIDAVIAWEFPSTYGEPAYLDDWRPDLDSAACAEHARCAVLGAHDRPRGADLTETATRRHSER